HAVDHRVVAAREVAGARPFDLDDARAKIRKLPRRKRRSHRLLDGDHGDSLQRKHQEREYAKIARLWPGKHARRALSSTSSPRHRSPTFHLTRSRSAAAASRTAWG